MERLLEDAEKIKAAQGEVAEYSIDSYADIVEAIHVVQTEMGITGTTSLEAAETISGSMASAKAMLENFTVGLVDTNQDIVGLYQNLSDSLVTVFSNIGPVIANFMTVGVRAIEDAVDPANKVERALGDIEKAQERVTKTNNVLTLISRYKELQAQVESAGGSESELNAIEDEMKSIREQLATATGNATIAQDEYNASLQTTLNGMEVQYQHQKEMLANNLYEELAKGAAAFKETVDEVTRAEQEQAEILETSANMSEYAQKSEADRAQTLKDLAKKLEEVSKSAGDGADHTDEFRAALDEAESAIRGISGEEVHFTDIFQGVDYLEEMSTDLETADKNTVQLAERNQYLTETIVNGTASMSDYLALVEELVGTGYYTMDDAAKAVGMSVEELTAMIEQSNATTESAVESSAELTAAMTEEELAAQALNQSLAAIGLSAYDALYSGENLRATYEELTSQLGDLEGELDETTLGLVENALAALDLAATNQELTEGYPAFIEAADNAGISVANLSQWLIDNGVTAEEWGEQVSAATDGVINDFTEAKTSTGQSVEEMKTALQNNINAYSNWNSNIAALMDAAVASGDQSKIAFVQSMQDLGIGAADQVAEMAEDIDGTLDEFGPMFQEAADQGMLEVKNSIDLGKAPAEASATEAMEGARDAMLDVDFTPTGEDAIEEFAAGAKNKTATAERATTAVANSAKAAAGGVDFSPVGTNMDSGMASGLYNGSNAVTRAARSVARSAYNAAKASLGIASPSKVFRDKIGKMITEGISVGMESADALRSLDESSGVITDTIFNGMQSLSNISPTFSTRDFGGAYSLMAEPVSYSGAGSPQIAQAAEERSILREIASKLSNVSGPTIIVNGADYQTTKDLAETISQMMYRETAKKEAALA